MKYIKIIVDSKNGCTQSESRIKNRQQNQQQLAPRKDTRRIKKTTVYVKRNAYNIYVHEKQNYMNRWGSILEPRYCMSGAASRTVTYNKEVTEKDS